VVNKLHRNKSFGRRTQVQNDVAKRKHLNIVENAFSLLLSTSVPSFGAKQYFLQLSMP